MTSQLSYYLFKQCFYNNINYSLVFNMIIQAIKDWSKVLLHGPRVGRQAEHGIFKQVSCSISLRGGLCQVGRTYIDKILKLLVKPLLQNKI